MKTITPTDIFLGWLALVLIFILFIYLFNKFSKRKKIRFSVVEYPSSNPDAETVTSKFNSKIEVDRSSRSIKIELSNASILSSNEVFHLLCGISDANEWGRPSILESSQMQISGNKYSIKCF